MEQFDKLMNTVAAFVDTEILPLLDEMPSVRLHVLRQSSHFYFPPQDQERILYA